MKKQPFLVAPWHVQHSCDRCEEGWVCENHPDKGWPFGCDCGGAGMPCEGLLKDMAKFQAEADDALSR